MTRNNKAEFIESFVIYNYTRDTKNRREKEIILGKKTVSSLEYRGF